MDTDKQFLTSDNLDRLQTILDRTCVDLGIDPASPFSVSAREFLARLLLGSRDAEAGDAAARLVRRAQEFGFDPKDEVRSTQTQIDDKVRFPTTPGLNIVRRHIDDCRNLADSSRVTLAASDVLMKRVGRKA
jgi:hypothetical protein